MSIEYTLDRIALALESIANSLAGQIVTGPGAAPLQIEVQAETKAAAEPKKPGRGRPAKITTEERAAATPAEVVEKDSPPKAPPVDDFLDTPAAPKPVEKPATLEEVRAALQAYAAKNGGGPEGTAKARALMTKACSNGATRLSIAKDVPGGDQGVLLPADYAAVIKAALA